jgi:Cu+-exporting ATPase
MRAVLRVKMQCLACANKVTHILQAHRAVTHAKVLSLPAGTLQVDFDESRVSLDTLVYILKIAGFPTINEKVAAAEKLPEESFSADFKTPLLRFSEVEKEEKSIDESFPTTHLVIGGMSCSSCVNTIETHLKSLAGVKQARVSLVLQSGTVVFDPSEISAEAIVEEVNDIGFEAYVPMDHSKDVSLQVDSIQSPENAIFQQQEKEKREWRNRLIMALVFSIPVFLIAMIFPLIPPLRRVLNVMLVNNLMVMDLLLWLLCTPVQFWVASTFYISAWKAVKHRSSNMAVLVVLGTFSAYVFSFIALVADLLGVQSMMSGAEHFFETSSTLITFVILGKFLESVAKQRTSQALTKLISIKPSTATLVLLDREEVVSEEVVAVSSLQIGDVVRVVKGEKIPSDGVVVKGNTCVNESMITGESVPAPKLIGDAVIGGCLNEESPVLVRVTRVGDETTLAQIIRLVEKASMSKTAIQSFADKVSAVFVPVVIGLAILTFIIWFSLTASGTLSSSFRQNQNPFLFSAMFALSVITVACPCALGLATPTAVMVGTGVGAQRGILIKGGGPLEVAHGVDSVVFDKTGTLTIGKPAVTDIRVTRKFQIAKNVGDEEILFLAGSAEKDSEHPLGRAIVEEARKHSIQLVSSNDFLGVTGRGMQCVVVGKTLHIGNREWMKSNGIQIDSVSEGIMHYLEDTGKTALCLSVDLELAAIFGIADVVRPEAVSLISALRRRGCQVNMLTGDNRRTANAVGARLGFHPDEIIAEALPGQKLEHILSLQRNKHVVAFVGDGINDSPSLAQADLGIAVASGSDIALEAADMVLMRNDISDVFTALDLSSKTFSRIKLNFVWALLFNCLGIPLAAGVFYPIMGLRLSPEFAALAMACSSLLVLTSSLLLNFYHRPRLSRSRSHSEDVDQVIGECCDCDSCGLVNDQQIQDLYRKIDELIPGADPSSLTDAQLQALPDLSLCSCSCSTCKCHRIAVAEK